MSREENEKSKRQWSWILYEVAAAGFSSTVMTGFFPIFFKQYWSFGVDPRVSTQRLGILLSISSFVIALTAPLLGAIADHRHLKKKLIFAFMVLGILATAALSFVEKGQWLFAAVLFGVGSVGFTSSNIFFDSLLPSVANHHDSDRVSARGFGMAYLGGGLLFAFNVMMYLSPQKFGLSEGVVAIKVAFGLVALWWAVLSIPLFRNVPEPHLTHQSKIEKQSLLRVLHTGLKRLSATIKAIRSNRNLLLFLFAYWLYIDGVYTVMKMAVDYGISLGFKSGDLITALLITQFVGVPFALLFGRLGSKFGCRIPIVVCIFTYALVIFGAVHMTSIKEFYALAISIGMVQGGVQALSRSLFAKMIPEESAGEYFGLYNLVGKFASVFGPSLVALTVFLTNNSREGMYGVLILFLAGGVLQLFVKEKRA